MSGALQGVLVRPDGTAQPTVGVLVLGGSSGRVDAPSARLLAQEGALGLRWFAGEGQAPGICEIPLEGFIAAIDRLHAEGTQRIAASGMNQPETLQQVILPPDTPVASHGVEPAAGAHLVMGLIGAYRDDPNAQTGFVAQSMR